MDIDRLRRIIAMFDATPGEASAAFARADDIIRTAGETWGDTLREIFGQPAQAEPLRISGVEFGHVDVCRDLLRNRREHLSPWEFNFLCKIAEKMHLSRKEQARLVQIGTIVDFRRDHRAEFSSEEASAT